MLYIVNFIHCSCSCHMLVIATVGGDIFYASRNSEFALFHLFETIMVCPSQCTLQVACCNDCSGKIEHSYYLQCSLMTMRHPSKKQRSDPTPDTASTWEPVSSIMITVDWVHILLADLENTEEKKNIPENQGRICQRLAEPLYSLHYTTHLWTGTDLLFIFEVCMIPPWMLPIVHK